MSAVTNVEARQYQTWMCLICGWVYHEELGDQESGLEPGTRWEDVPADWMCPDCGVGKDDFQMVRL